MKCMVMVFVSAADDYMVQSFHKKKKRIYVEFGALLLTDFYISAILALT